MGNQTSQKGHAYPGMHSHSNKLDKKDIIADLTALIDKVRYQNPQTRILWLSEHHSKTIQITSECTKEKFSKLSMLKNAGFDDEILNKLKLEIYKWNLNDTMYYYEKDNFCHLYCIGGTNDSNNSSIRKRTNPKYTLVATLNAS